MSTCVNHRENAAPEYLDIETGEGTLNCVRQGSGIDWRPFQRRATREGESAVTSQAAPPESPAAPIPEPAKRRLPAGTLCRGRVGMWSWVLHRITGAAIFFFLLVHILDTALIRISPEAYDAGIGTYKTEIMGLGKVALVAAIGLHALNGLRIIVIDLFSCVPR